MVFNAIGTYTISATYSGDGNYLGSADTETHTVGSGKIASATTITGTEPDPSVPGETVTVSVTVTGTDTTPTGTVDITGADTNCNVALTNGKGSCTVVFNSAGNKPLKAIYGGNAKYAGSMGSRNHNVHGKKANTETTITSDSPDPSMVGQPVTIQYSVTAVAPGQGTPTGDVTVSDGTQSCTGTVAAGGCSITFATPGIKSLTAAYAGDTDFSGSTSTPPTEHTVNSPNPQAADTTTTITSDLPDPSLVGQSVTIQYSVAVVAPGTGTPTGNVTVSDGAQSCAGTIAAGSCSIAFAAPGVKSLTATYAGDANFNGSVSTPPTAHTVNKIATTTTITSDLPDPSVVGEAVTINYSVAVVAPGQGTPTGDVTVSDGTQSCTGTVAAGTCSITFVAPGVKALTATYAGDTDFNGSVSTPPTEHTVNPANPNAADTTTTITSDLPDPSLVGQLVTIQYSVAVVAPGTGTPTGDVTVSDGTDSCTGTLAAGSCTIAFATPGVKSLTATYAGDANFNGSVSTPPTEHTVIPANPNAADTTTTITSDLPDPSTVGQPVTIKYSVVVVAPGTGTPIGDVTVSDGTQSCTGTVAAGSCTIAFATPGAKYLTATYAGDVNFNGSVSTPPTPHLVKQANPIFTGLVCLALYFALVIIIAVIALVILFRRRRRKDRKDGKDPPCEEHQADNLY